MKIKKIQLKNYRAIEDITVNLSYSINPIIGVNESGKTSVLQAILALDKSRDKYNKGEHLEYQNKYSTSKTNNCEISSYLTLSKDDIKRLIVSCKVKTDTEGYKYLQKINDTYVFKLTRNLSENKHPYYLHTEEELPQDTKESIIHWLSNNFPVILYFDDFSDRVPDEISFSPDYIEKGNLSRGSLREWQQIIEEIFRRAGLSGIKGELSPLQEFMKVEDSDRQSDILSDIVDILNKEIIEEWKKVKKRGNMKLADDSEKLEISLKNDPEGNFQFKVRDKSFSGKQRTFNVRERSKGFQWFFNYMLKLKFNPRYNKTDENSLFLLDEPGSYLHSSAQSELLKELKRVSQKNTIVFCTHSQFLLNPYDIRLGSIKIADKENSKVSLIPFGQYPSSKDKGALSPIYQALNSNFSSDFIGNVIVFEGISDFYFFSIIQKHWKVLGDYHFIGGTGSGSSSALISLCLSFSNDFRIVFDRDSGLKALKKYREEFGEPIEKKFVIYGQGESKFRLENHLTKESQKAILSFLDFNDIKKAIPEIFFQDIETQKKVISLIDQESKMKIKETIKEIEF